MSKPNPRLINMTEYTDKIKEIAKRILDEGKVEMVFFFRDPLNSHAHEVDVNMLMRICDVYKIPLATNPRTAELLLMSLAINN